MSNETTDLAVGESMVTHDGDDLIAETTRSEETLFTTTYTDVETGTLRLALQVDITTGSTAFDPRHIDRSFWTLVVEGDERSMSALEDALREIPDPSIEVKPERRELHLYSDEG